MDRADLWRLLEGIAGVGLAGRSPREAWQQARACDHELAAQGAAAVPVLIEALRHGRPEVAIVAVRRLGLLGRDAGAAAPALAEALERPSLAPAAAAALCRAGAPLRPFAATAVARLRACPTDAAAIRLVAAVGPTAAAAAPTLAGVLGHAMVRVEAARALLAMGARREEATAALLAVLDDVRARDFAAAARATSLCDPAAAPALTAALTRARERGDAHVQHEARRALARLRRR